MMMGSANILLVFLMIVFSPLLFDFAACWDSRCREIEWTALMDFKGSLVDEHNLLSSWAGRDCCSWYGITCHNLTGFVQMIDFSKKNSFDSLGGHISSSLLNLEHLEYLDLTDNNFSGIQIPEFLGSLRNLQYLRLENAGVSGEIPQHLGNLSNLQSLTLGGWNSFYKELSSRSLNWITGLPSLTSLKFTRVDLSESANWLDSINMLSSLSSLSLVDCGLVGMVLSGDLNLTSLVSIDLGANNFNSALNPSFFNLSNLIDIKISGSNLKGPIPHTIQKLTALNSLDLPDNSFKSSIPNSLCTLPALTRLYLSRSEFQGSIPVCIGNLTNLAFLSLRENKLSGAIPDELGSLTQLTNLELDLNQLSGKIPSSLGELTKLKGLGVFSNLLVGELSESFFMGMKSLESLSISETQLIINVSLHWIPPFQLQEIDIGSVFMGLFPDWLQTQTNLTDIGLANANIAGVIPAWIQTSYPRLSSLALSNNLLTGTIPTFNNVMNKDSISILALSGNQLTGHIPDELCNLHSMRTLKLANNRLIGRIPSCLGKLQRLWVLDLGNNSFSGHIPYEIGYLTELFVLNLNDNMLFGEVPPLQNLPRLLTLNLSKNKLQGSILNWIGKKRLYLEYLMLQSNNFSGEISTYVCQLSSLQILDLGDNILVGTIPSCLGNLSMMVSDEAALWIDNEQLWTINKGLEQKYSKSSLMYARFMSLSGNHLHGDIPDELMDLTGLHSLNLSNNELTGKIPERIGNMKKLESLDLSMNRLSGTIPQILAGIDTLSYLNLSFNNLSGRIPFGGHFDTFADTSVYEGNDELCGKPTTKKCDGDLVPSKQTGLVSNGDDDSEIELEWLYAGIGPGFAVGFLGVFCILFFKSSWRHMYFKLLEHVYNRF